MKPIALSPFYPCIIFCVLFFSRGESIAQCEHYFFTSKISPAGPVCSAQNVTLRTEYSSFGTSSFYGQFRWYTSQNASTPIHSYTIQDNLISYSDYSFFVSQTTTLWVSYFDYYTNCETFRAAYTVTVSGMPLMIQQYGRACGDGTASLQVSSNISNVSFELYKSNPSGGYQFLGSNRTGYFQIRDFLEQDAFRYYIKIQNPAGCNSSTYHLLDFDIQTSDPPVITGNTTYCEGIGTTLYASGGSAYRWYSGTNNLIAETPHLNLPALPVGNHTYYTERVSISGGCISNRATTVITVQPRPIDGTISASRTSICLGESVIISASGGVGTPHYWASNNGAQSWNIFEQAYEGQSSFSFTPQEAGTYRFHVRNRTSCGFCWDSGNNNCPTYPYIEVTVYSPSNGGITRSENTGQVSNVVHSNTFGATTLLDWVGDILRWEYSIYDAGSGYADWGQTGHSTTLNTCCIDAPGQRIWIRAVVKNGSCNIDYSDPTSYYWQLPNNFNWVKETTVLVNHKKNTSELASLSIAEGQKSVTYNYFDGLGRSMQTVEVQRSPANKDIVQPILYDALGRQSFNYLPFTAETNGYFKLHQDIISSTTGDYIGIAADFYNNNADNIADDGDKPYATTIFEPSPLNRVIKQGAPGASWQPDAEHTYASDDHTVKFSYEYNVTNEVLLWTYTYPDTTNPFGKINSGTTTGTYYASNQLYRNKTKDEQGHEVVEYIDKQGRVILKKVQADNNGTYAQTYYIHDNFGNLVCVLQPEGIKNINSYFAADELGKEEFLKKWAFRYTYDARKRMVMKQLPGADPVYLIYDNRDRLVLTQDGNQRSNDKNEWTFTKYDALNRPILTGIVDMGNKTVENLRDEVKDTDTYFETRGSVVHGYTNSAYPNVADENKYLTVTYYDDYDFLSSWTGYNYTDENLFATGHGILYEQPDNHFPFVKGQVTGGKTKVLDGSNTWLKSVNYYDDKYRLVQTIADNHLGGIDKTTNLYDFVGKVLKTRTRHSAQLVDRRFEYDHAGRLLETWHSIDGADDILLAKNEYNELGQLVTKKLHSTSPSSAFKQSVDYRYNIRGWLEKINDVAAPEPDDFFSMELKYNNPSSNGGTAQYNGNISEIVWKGAGMDEQSYGFYYDPMNRLTDANYFNATTPGTNGRFNERIGTPDGTGSRYDLNGNILHLTRHGKKDGSPSPYGPMDELTYTYTGNQVTRIDDTIDRDVAEQGFKEEVKADNEYTYDANGNMTKDANKGITSITYNHLNLPVKVSKSETEYIEYTYDATGRKLRQQVFGSTPKTTDYQGEFVYENNVLQFINHEEGRVVMTGSTPEYQYHLKDHLGNVRLTFTSKEEVEESIATMEDASAAEEEVNYLYYNEAIKVNHPLFDRTDDHTPGGATHNATRLTGGNTNAVYGLARSLSVMPGDKINMEVWAKYLQLDPNPENWSASVRDFLTQYTEGSTTGVIDGGAAGSIGNTVFPYAGLLNREEIDEQAPKAFITWLVFDRDYNPLIEESGYMQIGIEAKETGSNIPHQRLYRTAPLEIKQAGFVYIYLSNENETSVEVFFDDFKVEHIKSSVIQTQDYYPFGLAFNSYSRENSVENKIKFNGREEQDELGWNVYDYKRRFYDQALGRFISVDPLASSFPWWTPYQFTGNMPTKFVDLDGMEPAYYDPQTQTIIPASDHFRHTPPANAQYLNEVSQAKIRESNEASKTAFSFMPFLDVAIDGTDAINDFRNGNYGMGMLSTASLFPGADIVTKPLKALLKNGDEAVFLIKKVEKYEVGTFDDLTKRSEVGDGLDIHHVSQKQPAGQLIDGYDKSTAPSIALPSSEHRQIPTLKGANTAGTPRQQLAKDIWDLRQNTNAPNSSLQQLIDLNKQLYPNAFKKQ